MNIHVLTVGPFEVNGYIVWLPGSSDCLVIDPGAEAERFVEFLKARRLRPAVYLLTHGHIDHVSGLPELADRYPAPAVLHTTDAEWAFTSSNRLPPFYEAVDRAPDLIQTVEDGEWRQDAGLAYTVIATPGHSPGGVCFYFEEQRRLFSGDTLFRDSVGRTDLPGGNPRVLAQSLKKLARLPDDVTVHPGHGPSTSLAEEKRNNFFFR